MRQTLGRLVSFLFGTSEPPAPMEAPEHVHVARRRRVSSVELDRCA
jgi:hypothetical protein